MRKARRRVVLQDPPTAHPGQMEGLEISPGANGGFFRLPQAPAGADASSMLPGSSREAPGFEEANGATALPPGRGELAITCTVSCAVKF